MYTQIIGIIGLASQATAHLFKRLVDAFPGEKEWDRPQVIINNDCTIPSRVRAILYGENEEQIKTKLEECVRGILRCAGEKSVRLIIDCNTAHYYIKHLKEVVPEADFIDIIETCSETLLANGIKNAVVFASEGIFETKIYDSYFQPKKISIEYPLTFMKEIRYFIECVKQNVVTKESLDRFHELLLSHKGKIVILGCTELPVLWEQLPNEQKAVFADSVYDPLQCVIEKLQRELK